MEKTESRATGQQSSTRERTREREKSKGNIFCSRNNMKFCCSGEKMRNACFHQSKHERREKQKNIEQVHVRHFLHLTGNQEVSGSFTL